MDSMNSPVNLARARAAHRAEGTDAVRSSDVNRILRMIRPSVRKRGGDVRLVGVAASKVTVELSGACPECPIDFEETSGVIDRVVRSRIPQVEALTVV